MPEWLDYEKLIAQIYAELGPAAEVKHDDHILGKSGIQWQIDVSIRSSIAGHGILIAVQAKDLARPADVGEVCEFESTLNDIQASKGVLICSSGFTNGAELMARSNGRIDLCSAHDAESKKWGISLRIPLLWVEYSIELKLGVIVVVDRPHPIGFQLDHNFLDWSVLGADLGENATVKSILTREWDNGRLDKSVGGPHVAKIETPGVRARLASEFDCSLDSITVTYSIARKSWLGSFSFSECRGIVSHTSGTFVGTIGLHLNHLPRSRHAEWKEVADPKAFESAANNLLVVECGLGGPGGWNIQDTPENCFRVRKGAKS